MDDIYEVLGKTKQIAIYGAGVVAFNIANALKLVYGIDTVCFFVSRLSDGGAFGGIQAVEYSEEKFYQYGKPLILVATPEEYHEEIVKRLADGGVKTYYLIDASVDYELMKQFYGLKGAFMTVESLQNSQSKRRMGDDKRFEVYMAKSIWDKPLKKLYEIPEWTIQVQAGKRLTELRVAEYTDDFEGGISGKNRNYCELTVTYWAWKMRHAAYKGICHYRRIFVLSKQDIDRIKENDIDVVLPIPFFCKPDASEQYFRYITKSDFAVFMRIISELYPDRTKEIVRILHSDNFYNYNMIIAKDRVFQQYCEFMFPVLFKMEDYFKQREIERQDRYLGYFGELLTSIYFSLHFHELKIVHAKKQWLI